MNRPYDRMALDKKSTLSHEKMFVYLNLETHREIAVLSPALLKY